MPDSDKTLKLEIDIARTGDGAAQAAAELGQVKKAAAAEGEQLAETAKRTEEAGISTRELGHALREIGDVAAPGAGRAMSELRLGPLGAAFALVEAYEKVKESVDDLEKKEEELNETELEDHRKNIENLQKAWDDALISLGKYFAAVKTAGQDEDPHATQLARIKAVSAAQTEAHLKEIEELGKVGVAWLKAHGASPERIAAAEAANQATLDKVRDSAADKSIADIQADIDARKADRPKLDRASSDAIAQAAQADARLKAAQGQFDQASDPKAIAEAKKKQDAAAEFLNNAKQLPDFESDPISGIRRDERGRNKETVAKAQADVQEAKAESDRLTAAAATARDKVTLATVDKNNADAAAERASKAGTDNETKIRTEGDEVTTATAVQAEKAKGEKVQDAIRAAGLAQHNEQHASGLAEMQQALNEGIAAQQGIVAAVKLNGGSNRELHAALQQEFAEQRADNLRLAAQIAVTPATAVQAEKAKGEKVQDAIRAAGLAQHNEQYASGLAEMQQALNEGIAAQQGIVAAVKLNGGSNRELHAALQQEFAEQRADNLRLAAQIAAIRRQTNNG